MVLKLDALYSAKENFDFFWYRPSYPEDLWWCFVNIDDINKVVVRTPYDARHSLTQVSFFSSALLGSDALLGSERGRARGAYVVTLLDRFL